MSKHSNLSRIHQELLLKKIAHLRTYLEEHPAKNLLQNRQLLTDLSDIEREIQGKQYGLVFESHQEPLYYSSKLQAIGPLFVEEFTLSGSSDPAAIQHRLIEGENLVVLKYLQITHSQKINVICIDPPYNTGNLRLGYEDSDYTDVADANSHSNWLSLYPAML